MNFIVPETAARGTAAISIQAGGNEIADGTATISAAGPGIFVLQSANPQQPGAIENQDYSVNTTSNPAAAGTVAQIYATGYGGDALPVQSSSETCPPTCLSAEWLAPACGRSTRAFLPDCPDWLLFS